MMPPVKEPLAGLALLVIFGLLIWYNRPIQSSSPLDPYIQQQDPRFTGHTGHAYESWLWEDPFRFDEPAPKKKSEPQCKDQLNKNNIKNVKILVPLLKVRPDTKENKELRARHRYAVIAGLIESGYRPQAPDRLHFCSIQECHDKEYDVRWEHYRYETRFNSDKDKTNKDKTNKSDNKPDIIVVWMNSEIFTNDNKFNLASENLLKLKEISKNNFYILDLNNSLDQEHSKKITTKIINKKNFIKAAGTDDDNALIGKLTEELELRNIKESSEVIIITEQDSENVRNLTSNFRKSLCNSLTKDKSVDTESHDCGIRNVFYLKGVDPNQQIIHKQDKNKDHQAADKKTDSRPVIDLHNSPPLPVGSSQLDYFHRLAEQINGPHKDINPEKRDSGIKAVVIFGSNFHDKLRILEALRAKMPHILILTTDLDAQMLHPQHWRSTRNLVVASHFNLLKDRERDDKEYQKPQPYQEQPAPFRDSQQTNIFSYILNIVTNDVPPKIPLPQIFEIGRNGFVRLGQEENENVTSNPSGSAADQAIPMPLVQTWLLLLLPQDQTKLRLLLLAGIVVFLICFHGAIRPNSRKLTRSLFLITSVIFAIAWFFAMDKLGEPLSFTDGISLWPTIFIQIIAISMAGSFFYRARRELDENFCCLSRQYFEISLNRNREDFPNCLDEDERGWELSKFSKLSRIPSIILIFSFVVYAYNDVKPLILQFIMCFVLLFFFLAFYLINTKERGYVSIKDCMKKDNCQPKKTHLDNNFCLIRNTLHELLIFFRLKNGSDSRSGLHSENYEDCLWREYYKYGVIDNRLTRVVAMWLFFAIIETILIYLLPPWPFPCRGSTCGWASWTGGWASWTEVVSFSVIMLLLFFILDAVRLSCYWIQKLRKRHPLLADRITPEHVDAFNIAKKNNPFESLENIVAVVAERTRVVDKLIYYAMFCIMLTLFAKINYFDNQDFPLSKGITFAASISLLFFSGFMLRYEANQLRLSVSKSVENLGKNNRRIQPEARKVIKRIKGICEGAFQPMFEQPVMQALIIILASIGLFAGEYLKLLG